ncbi:MAG: alpha/beta fold hydrolase [Candidatus Kapabacteria bacterium]|jgi:predicted alpha/beta hydrolase|nr:alpha/beta fold hydrolase [Candidatus Kapabacteria bacterium]
MQTFNVQKEDGSSITATQFLPEKPCGRTLLISPATGMKQTFYYAFAEYFATLGYHVFTYDYSGIGLSKEGSLRGSMVSYSTWGKDDFPAMVRTIKEAHPDNKRYLVGHSLGGNILGLTDVASTFDGIVTVASQHGYWRNFHASNRWGVWFIFAVSMPFLTKLFGYFPAKTHGLGEDLPRYVLRDWSKVILSPNGVESLAASPNEWRRNLQTPLLCISLDDDTYAPKQTVDNLAFRCYSETAVERLHITPVEVQVKAIGHLNFFRRQFQSTLWQLPHEWFEKQATTRLQISESKQF